MEKIYKNFLHDYNSTLVSSFDQINSLYFSKLVSSLLKYKNSKSKIYIIGNGGSSAIASHISVDLTKSCSITSTNFNEPDLITCFANDYGYEKWVENAIKFYVNDKDLVILISSSGESKNIINAAKYCKSKHIKLITFSGFKKNNSLFKLGNINFYVNSNSYNIVELTHLSWLMAAVDFIKES